MRSEEAEGLTYKNQAWEPLLCSKRSSSYTSSLLKDPEACSSHFRWDCAHGHYLQKQASTHSHELLGSDTIGMTQEHPPPRVLQRF